MVHRVDLLGHGVHIHASRPTVVNLVLPEPLPLKDVLASRCSTIRHVPAVLQQTVTSTLAAAITRYSADPSESNLFLVLGFPKLVLRVTKAKGKFSADAVVASLRHRLSQFQQGNIRALWHDFSEEMARENKHRPVTRASKRARSSEKGRIADNDLRRARTLVGEGATRKALDSLMSEGSHDPSDPAVLDKLRSLHPDGAPLATTLPSALDPMLTPPDHDTGYMDALVRDAILRFPRASAPGPSGLRPSHLQDAIRRRGGGLGLIRSLASLTTEWVNGRLPASHSPFWCGANLTPLKKSDGGVRPVAVGETLRRLVGKVLLSTGPAGAGGIPHTPASRCWSALSHGSSCDRMPGASGQSWHLSQLELVEGRHD